MKRLGNVVLVGDVRDRLAEIAPASVDCIITSPPYFQLRDYGTPEQLGMEPTVQDWVDNLMDVLKAAVRVLKPTGSVWLNVGDAYSRHASFGARRKSLLLGPERLVVALEAAGWIVRNKIIWAKSNPMPSSVCDRLSPTYEVVYLLTRSEQYFFDLDAIRIPHRSQRRPRISTRAVPGRYPPPGRGATSDPQSRAGNAGLSRLNDRGISGHPLGKNPGDVWMLPTASYRGAHFATFPKGLIERPLLATCPERVCLVCGIPWERAVARQLGLLAVAGGLAPRCTCAVRWQPGLVLDPFIGSGTVALEALRLKRRWLGIELNPDYAAMAARRVADALREAA